jgi:hypothetical protein
MFEVGPDGKRVLRDATARGDRLRGGQKGGGGQDADEGAAGKKGWGAGNSVSGDQTPEGGGAKASGRASWNKLRTKIGLEDGPLDAHLMLTTDDNAFKKAHDLLEVTPPVLSCRSPRSHPCCCCC